MSPLQPLGVQLQPYVYPLLLLLVEALLLLSLVEILLPVVPAVKAVLIRVKTVGDIDYKYLKTALNFSRRSFISQINPCRL